MENDSLEISVGLKNLPEDGVEKVKSFVKEHESILVKGMAADCSDVELDEEKITFPWFHRIPEAGEVDAAMKFLSSLVQVVAKKNDFHYVESENEKESFERLLLEVGMTGDDFEESRSVMLRNFN